MQPLLRGWEALCSQSPALQFVDINLRGFGQVMFQDNPLTGALFLAAVAWGSVVAGVPHVLLAGVLRRWPVDSTLTAIWLKADKTALAAGLYGYNGVLVGLALATFLAQGAALWIYVALGAAVSTVATLGTASTLKPFGAPALTAPFVAVAWIMLLATYGFAGLSGAALPAAGVVAPFEPAAPVSVWLGTYLTGTFLSISQVFLKASVVSALLSLVGLAVSSVPAALFALGGAMLAVAVAHAFGAESDLVTQGLLGFEPGADSDRAWRDFPPAEPQDDPLCRAWCCLHGRCAGGAQRRAASLCAAGADRPFRSCLLDVLAVRRAAGEQFGARLRLGSRLLGGLGVEILAVAEPGP